MPLLRRREGWPDNLPDRQEGLFRLGKWGLLTNGIAVLYGVAMTINLMWPRTALYIDDTYKWGPITAVIVLVGVGLVYYYAVQQHKTGVLEEHRADGAEAAATVE